LHFDDDSVVKVGGVLDNPTIRESDTLSDPLEGPAYGRGKAYVHVGADGAPWIYSFAHGGMNYRLRYDVAAVRTRLVAVPDADLVDRFVKLLLWAEVTRVEEDALVDEVAHRTRNKIRSIQATIKAARERQRKQRAETAREKQRATRTDPRPQVDRPDSDAPLIPKMETVNAVFAAAPPRAQMLRDVDGDGARRHKLAIPPVQPYDEEDDADD
jgi:hypothetical protein